MLAGLHVRPVVQTPKNMSIDQDKKRRPIRVYITNKTTTFYISHYILKCKKRIHDAGRDGRTCYARPKFSSTNGDNETFNFPASADHEQDSQPNRLMPSLLYVMAVHPYTHTYIHTHMHIHTHFINTYRKIIISITTFALTNKPDGQHAPVGRVIE